MGRERDPGNRNPAWHLSPTPPAPPSYLSQGAAKTPPQRPQQGDPGILPVTGHSETSLRPTELPCRPCLQPHRAAGRLRVLHDGWETQPHQPALALGCHPPLPRRWKWKPPARPPRVGVHGESHTESRPRSVRPRAGLLLAPSAVCPLPPQILFQGHQEQAGTSLVQGKRKTIIVSTQDTSKMAFTLEELSLWSSLLSVFPSHSNNSSHVR